MVEDRVSKEELQELVQRMLDNRGKGETGIEEFIELAGHAVIHLNEYMRFMTRKPYTGMGAVVALRVLADLLTEMYAQKDDTFEAAADALAAIVGEIVAENSTNIEMRIPNKKGNE